MANTEVPITVVSAATQGSLSVIVIGKQQYGWPSVQERAYWFSVYDRYTLQQVYSYVQAATVNTVPADLAGKFNTNQYFFVMATRTMYAWYIPNGPLYSFLVQHGAGKALKTLSQALMQIGCGSLDVTTYAMAGVLGPGITTPGNVEASAMAMKTPRALILEATLVGVPVQQGTLYTPVPLTAPTP